MENKTDEPLCEKGMELLENKSFPDVDFVFSSPMKRCIQTAQFIYSRYEPYIIDKLAECDFGTFENKNYLELEGNTDYQEWIDSNGMLPFPGGESREEFAIRSLAGFKECLNICLQNHITCAAVVVHGGSIMTLLDQLAVPHEDYFHWHVKNACGYEIELDENMWKNGKEQVKIIREV